MKKFKLIVLTLAFTFIQLANCTQDVKNRCRTLLKTITSSTQNEFNPDEELQNYIYNNQNSYTHTALDALEEIVSKIKDKYKDLNSTVCRHNGQDVKRKESEIAKEILKIYLLENTANMKQRLSIKTIKHIKNVREKYYNHIVKHYDNSWQNGNYTYEKVGEEHTYFDTKKANQESSRLLAEEFIKTIIKDKNAHFYFVGGQEGIKIEMDKSNLSENFAEFFKKNNITVKHCRNTNQKLNFVNVRSVNGKNITIDNQQFKSNETIYYVQFTLNLIGQTIMDQNSKFGSCYISNQQ